MTKILRSTMALGILLAAFWSAPTAASAATGSICSVTIAESSVMSGLGLFTVKSYSGKNSCERSLNAMNGQVHLRLEPEQALSGSVQDGTSFSCSLCANGSSPGGPYGPVGVQDVMDVHYDTNLYLALGHV